MCLTLIHHRLKCDRNQPCENCVKRDIASTCTFIHAGIIRDKATHIQKHSSATTPRDVHGRIRHLEDLVISLMQSNGANGNSTITSAETQPPSASSYVSGSSFPKNQSTSSAILDDSNVLDTSESFGRISIEDEQLNYVGGSHWAAILDSVCEQPLPLLSWYLLWNWLNMPRLRDWKTPWSIMNGQPKKQNNMYHPRVMDQIYLSVQLGKLLGQKFLHQSLRGLLLIFWFKPSWIREI